MSRSAATKIANLHVGADQNTQAGSWAIAFNDIVIVSTDGTVTPIYSNQTGWSLSCWGNNSGSFSNEHVANVGWAASTTTTYYHGDHLGSTRLLSGYNGYPIATYTYGPYGEEFNSQTTVNHYKFTGKERDGESGLDNFGARYHGSNLGRFMTPDPLNTLDLSHPQKLNRYTYANNNPLSYVDVGGRCTAPAISTGQVGICIESYIQTRFLPGAINHAVFARGDNRGPNPHGGSFRTQTLLSVDPSTHGVSIVGAAAGESCAIRGCYQGLNNSRLSKTTYDDKGNTYFTLTVEGINGYQANGKLLAPTGSIGMQVSFKVDAKGNVTVLDSETKGYPSVSIYSYDSEGNVESGWQQTENGNIDDLNGPLKPANFQHAQEEADRQCKLGNPAACN